MPHSAARLNEVNNRLEDTTGDTGQIIQNATTLPELAEALGLSDDVRNFVGALTPAVQASALGAIKGAADQGWSVHTTWQPGAAIRAVVFEDLQADPQTGKGTVTIAFSTPAGGA